MRLTRTALALTATVAVSATLIVNTPPLLQISPATGISAEALAEDIADLHRDKHDVLVVSSGAIALAIASAARNAPDEMP